MTGKWFNVLLLAIVLSAGFFLGRIPFKAGKQLERRILYYKDPMHPSYRSNRPGVAPDCGMELVPVYADEVSGSLVSDQAAAKGMDIDPVVQQLYGIRLAKAERNQPGGAVQVFGRVMPDETLIYHVNFGTEGYVKETADDAVGNFVSKNQRLAVVYSPDFLAAAGGYLAAHERSPNAPNAMSGNSASNASQEAASVQARADRLRNLGMSDAQIDEITRTRRLPEDIYVVAPTDGFILSRRISPGMRFERESDLYTIANLKHVWILAEVFGADAQAFRPGAKVAVTLPDTGQNFQAKVSAVLPEIDPATRAMKIRLEADNAGYKLRPDMYVSISAPVSPRTGISVPAEAILDSGLAKRVFVQTSTGSFEPRTVETGWESGDRVQIVNGLKEGESVVYAGTFLVDSETKLRGADQQSGSPALSAKMTNLKRSGE